MALRLNRRQWLKTGAAAVAGAALAPRWAEAAVPSTRRRDGPIRLHSNENPYGPSESARRAMTEAFDLGNLYTGYEDLETLIAEREGLSPQHVVLGAGSHEVLRMAAMAFGLPDGEIVTGYPTFEGLERYAQSIGAPVAHVPLDADMRLNLGAMARRVTSATRLVFVCNPNNPTGTVMPGHDVEGFCRAVARRVPVLVDEAYHEYVEDFDYASMVPLVREGENVIVSRTFSKIYGLAGLRVGYGLAPPPLAERLRRYRTNNSVNIVGRHAAAASYQDGAFVAMSRAKNARARAFAADALEARGHRCLPSHANFVFFHLGRDVRGFGAAMQARGIRVGRPFPPLTDWCRLSIGTMEEMQAFIEAFDALGAGG